MTCPPRFSAKAATVIATSMVAVASGALTGLYPVIATVAVCAVAAIVWSLPRLVRSASLAVLLAFTTLPGGVPTYIAFGSLSVNLYEPFLLIALLTSIVALYRHRNWDRGGVFWLAAFGIAVAMASAIGLVRGAESGFVFRDARGLLTMLAAAFTALALSPEDRRSIWRVLASSMVASAIITLGASVFGYGLQGRSETARLWAASGGGGLGSAEAAARFISPATGVALCIVTGLLARILKGRRLSKLDLAALVSAVLVAFLSFSRFQLVAIPAAISASLLIAVLSRDRSALRTTKRIGVAGLALITAVFIIPAAAPTDSYVARQVKAFSDRVLTGLDSEVRARDSSTQDRETENGYMLKGLSDYPVVGSGFGYAYKPASGELGQFANVEGRYYGHQFYLWISLKAGLLGFSTFCALMLLAMRRSIQHKSEALLGVSLALAIVCNIAPYPEGTSNAIAIGAALGLAYGLMNSEPIPGLTRVEQVHPPFADSIRGARRARVFLEQGPVRSR